MKKIHLLIAVLTIISCKQEAPVDYAIISGSITNSKATEIEIRADGSFVKKILLAQDGSFSDTLTLKPGMFSIYEARNITPLYLEAGNNIHISYDAKDFNNTLNYTGNGTEICNYLFKKTELEKAITGNRKELNKLDEEKFKTAIQGLKTDLTELLTNAAGISEEYKSLEKRNIHYSYLISLNRYEEFHGHYTKNKDFKVTEGFLVELDDIDYENETDYFYSFDYKKLVKNHHQKESEMIAKENSTDKSLEFLINVSTVENEAIRNNLLYEAAKSGWKYTDDLQVYSHFFMDNSTNEEYKASIKETYNKFKTVSAGQPSPKFVNYENHAGGTTSLDDLKGKYVYIDLWATWCGPCKYQIPYLKEVEKKYRGKNIEFVSISFDYAKDHDKWVKMVNEEELGGIQLLGDNAWKSKFVKDYFILGIPHFILLDPKGIIVKYRAPAPSDPKLVELFDKLNI